MRKKMFSALLLIALLFSAIPTGVARAADPPRYTGSVLSSVTLGLIVRDAPITGARVGKLAAGTPIKGDDLITGSDSRQWMHIVSPATGWIAAWYLRYTDSQTPPVVDKYPAIPGPYILLSHWESDGQWFWPDGKLTAYPAIVPIDERCDNRPGKGTLTYNNSWLSALRAKWTAKQWRWFWGNEAGIHNKPYGEVGRVQMVTSARNQVWAYRVDESYVYIDPYYNDEPAPSLTVIDKYRLHIVSVEHKTLHRDNGGIFYPDAGFVYYPLIATRRGCILRIEKRYTRALSTLPAAVNVDAGGGRLNVRSCPVTCSVVTALDDETPVTVFELRKVGSAVWGRITQTGSAAGWVSLVHTTWGR